MFRIIVAAVALQLTPSVAPADTVFNEGTSFVDTRIMSAADPTSFTQLTYKGTFERQMYDRRSGWVTPKAFVFDAQYNDGNTVEVQVNPEFGTREAAEAEAVYFATEVGRLPAALREKVETIWIHDGDYDFGGGNNNILIHTQRAEFYENTFGALHEILVHESVHTSLDGDWANSAEWREAQREDDRFISPYAEQFPEREDLAETFLIWMASRYFPDRVGADVLRRAEEGNAARFKVLDELGLDMSPYERQR